MYGQLRILIELSCVYDIVLHSSYLHLLTPSLPLLKVMNGASDLLGQALGKDIGGCHARSAIGTNSLPLGIAVEVEMIAKIAIS